MLPPGSVKPDYTGYCLSNVPSTAVSILGQRPGRPALPPDALGSVETSGVENVILVLCDGLGMNEWQRKPETGFFGALSRKGSVMPITTVFPSTTAAALTSVSTGLTPQEHGLPEWFVYMKEVGEIVVTLPFTRVGDHGRDTLKGILPGRALVDGTTIFRQLKEAGVGCMSFIGRSLANTVYSKASRDGCAVTPYVTASDLGVSLRRHIEGARGRNFVYVYWSYVDTIEHIYGPRTDEARVETSLISHALQEGFLDRLDRGAAKRTIVILTADHGQLTIEPEKTLYMNRWGVLNKNLRKDPRGNPIPPWGSARDAYLAVEDDTVDKTKSYLQEKLDGVATVLETEEAIREGLFGINSPSRRFRSRVGNLMILPHCNKTVWYKYAKGNALDLRGHHGGLTKDEMEVPLAAARLSDLQ
ncbi:MAG: alkaline phosphatase family protein [Nitrososphaerota archaeon]|nr:alkaline phosphatase family protein [Nitrososphaerota archaeon]MDG6943113.1 alkaline phosphatase family protein [Nitrososphaerota archaeon]MDG6951009.1 alkaline phosphatase family protein [Nitrososphaerota archaeon]